MPLTGDEIYKIPRTCRSEIQGNINSWFKDEDSKRRQKSIMHISIENAYKFILNQLSTMDENFYKYIDGQNLKPSIPINDPTKFAISKLIDILNILYWVQEPNELFNYESENTNKESDWITVNHHKKAIHKIRESYAYYIWSAWSNERYRCPRFGRIIISNNITDEIKVLAVYYIKDNVLHLGFPKGKPNVGESIKDGSSRETMEETGVSREDLCMYTGQNGEEVIKKYPYIRHIKRKYYYVMTTTSVEFTTFKPQKHEIQGVVWYPVDRIPCGDDCCVPQNLKFVNGQYEHVSFHMLTLRNKNNEKPVTLNILNFVNKINRNQDATIRYWDTHRFCKCNME